MSEISNKDRLKELLKGEYIGNIGVFTMGTWRYEDKRFSDDKILEYQATIHFTIGIEADNGQDFTLFVNQPSVRHVNLHGRECKFCGKSDKGTCSYFKFHDSLYLRNILNDTLQNRAEILNNLIHKQ